MKALLGLVVVAAIVVGILYATGVIGGKKSSIISPSGTPLGPGGLNPLPSLNIQVSQATLNQQHGLQYDIIFGIDHDYTGESGMFTLNMSTQINNETPKTYQYDLALYSPLLVGIFPNHGDVINSAMSIVDNRSHMVVSSVTKKTHVL